MAALLAGSWFLTMSSSSSRRACKLHEDTRSRFSFESEDFVATSDWTLGKTFIMRASIDFFVRSSKPWLSRSVWARSRAVSAVELQDSPPEPQPSLILRRMAEGETLWDIAKQYRTDQDAIRSANELTEEARPEGMLLIPRVR